MPELAVLLTEENQNTDFQAKQFGRSPTYLGERFEQNDLRIHTEDQIAIVQPESTGTENVQLLVTTQGYEGNFLMETESISIAEVLATKSEQYEQIENSFPGVVTNIEESIAGEPESVIISVSVEGKDYLIRRSIRNIDFEVKPEMRLEVDCVVRGGQKRLVFRAAQPVELDEEEIELLESI